MAKPAEASPTLCAPGKPADHVPTQPPESPGLPRFTAPSFYITRRQPLGAVPILLAIVATVVALSSIVYALKQSGATSAAGQRDDDDPNQVDTIVLGDPADAPRPARPGEHYSPVHPTILVRLPRFGDQMGLIPNTPAGHLLYDWLAAFNRASYAALANALPNAALPSATAAQMQLRQQTGGFSLLSAKEVQPGVLVFRLREATPAATEVLGTLQMRENLGSAAITSFSLRAVSPPGQASTAGAASLPAIPAR